MKLKTATFLIALTLAFCMFGCAMKSVDDLQGENHEQQAGICAEFYGVSWGMTQDEVKALAGKPFDESETSLGYINAKLFEASGFVTCTFDENGLKSVKLEAISADEAEAKALLESTGERINGKYGTPEENKLDIESINGDYTWETNGTTIRLYNYVGTNIVYISFSKAV